MKKYTIKNNRPELTKEEIERGMDFSKIRSGATGAKIFTLKTIILSGIAAAVAIAITIYWPEISGTGSESISVRNEIAKLPTTTNSPDTFLVNSEKDTTLVYTSGTQIKIPGGVFVDEKGEAVKGKVNIHYREFHKVSEILLSSIPMRYDSAGKEMYFESAGMFDISATQNSKQVYIRNDRSLEVAMSTLDRSETKYNQYLLDEKTGQWKFMKKDEVAVFAAPDTVYEQKVVEVKSHFPVKPLNERMFTIDADGRPDLKVYNNIVFEITKECKNFKPEESKTEWGMVNVERSEEIVKTAKSEATYKVTFSYPLSGPQRTYEVTAKPVKDGNLEKAMEKYDALYAEYKNKLSAAEKADMEAEEKLRKEENRYEDVFEKYKALEAKNAALFAQNAALTATTSAVVYRTFQIKQFGVWNSDCPQSMPQGVEVFAKFETATGEPVKIATVFLVEKGKNALYNLYSPSKFSFNPDAENVLLVITRDNKLGWITNDVFKNIGKDVKNFTFKLNILKKDNYTSGDIDNIVI
jgi:hypothetical protein